MEKMKNGLLAYNNWMSKGLVLAMIMLILTNLSALAQSRPVTGKVVANGSDSSLGGATVHVKGSNVSAVTNADGSFTINAVPNATLVISNIGYTTMEFALNNR